LSKNRNLNKKQARREAKEQAARQRQKDLIYAVVVALLAFATVLVLTVHVDYVYLETERGTDAEGETVLYFHDRDHGVTYLAAPPFAYEPVLLIEKAYAKYDGCFLYPMEGVSPTQFLAYEVTEGIYDIYYNEELTLPTLSDDIWSGIDVCIDQTLTPQCFLTLSEKNKVVTVQDEILNGKTVEVLEGTVDGIFNLRFTTKTYPFLYFCVKYITTEEGYNYYYNYLTDTYITAGDTLDEALRDYAEGAEEELGETTS